MRWIRRICAVVIPVLAGVGASSTSGAAPPVRTTQLPDLSPTRVVSASATNANVTMVTLALDADVAILQALKFTARIPVGYQRLIDSDDPARTSATAHGDLSTGARGVFRFGDGTPSDYAVGAGGTLIWPTASGASHPQAGGDVLPDFRKTLEGVDSYEGVGALRLDVAARRTTPRTLFQVGGDVLAVIDHGAVQIDRIRGALAAGASLGARWHAALELAVIAVPPADRLVRNVDAGPLRVLATLAGSRDAGRLTPRLRLVVASAPLLIGLGVDLLYDFSR